MRRVLVVLLLVGGCRPRPTSQPPTVLRKGSAFSISETFELAEGKAKAFRVSLPQGGTISVDFRVKAGPAVDLFCIAEAAFQSYVAGTRPAGGTPLNFSTSSSGFSNQAILAPGTWYVGIWNPARNGTCRALVVDADTLKTHSGLGNLRDTEDLAKEQPDEVSSTLQLTLESWSGTGTRPAALNPPIPFDYSFEVEADGRYLHRFWVDAGSVPGRLSGSWSSAGMSADIDSKADDTLTSFELFGRAGPPVQKSQYSTSGTFELMVRQPEFLSFIFDNTGFDRSAKRRVTLKGRYDPD